MTRSEPPKMEIRHGIAGGLDGLADLVGEPRIDGPLIAPDYLKLVRSVLTPAQPWKDRSLGRWRSQGRDATRELLALTAPRAQPTEA